jgi:ABC-type dipeptide/oligopeptide/nickel transport system permease subunit
MVIGTALGLSNFPTIVLAVVLAFLFGYSLTNLPLLRVGLALSAVVPPRSTKRGSTAARRSPRRRRNRGRLRLRITNTWRGSGADA